MKTILKLWNESKLFRGIVWCLLVVIGAGVVVMVVLAGMNGSQKVRTERESIDSVMNRAVPKNTAVIAFKLSEFGISPEKAISRCSIVGVPPDERLSCLTDDQGRCVFRNLEANGRYSFFVNCDGYIPMVWPNVVDKAVPAYGVPMLVPLQIVR